MARMSASRRSFLTAGAGFLAAGAASVGLVESRVVPGRVHLHSALGLTGKDGTIPVVRPGRRVDQKFTSRARGGQVVRWSVAYPPQSPTDARLPVVLALHGRGGDHMFAFDDMGLDRFMAAGMAEWPSPFAVVSVDGGPDSFWHRREDGDDPMAMVRNELLPRLADRGLRTAGIGLIGWSMGGYGALLLAERHTDLLAAAVVTSPALWRTWDEVRPGAFDSRTDFRANDVFADQSALRELPMRIDCGHDDPFAAATQAFVDGLEKQPTGGFQPGAHTVGYWRRMVPDQLAFLAWNL